MRETHQVTGRTAVGLDDDVEPVHAEQFWGRHPDDRFDGWCDVYDGQVVVEDQDDDGRVLQHQAQPALAASLDDHLADVEAIECQRHRLGQ